MDKIEFVCCMASLLRNGWEPAGIDKIISIAMERIGKACDGLEKQ